MDLEHYSNNIIFEKNYDSDNSNDSNESNESNVSNVSNESNESFGTYGSNESLNSDVNSIDLNINQYKIKRIKYNRNRPRSNHNIYFGALAFDVIWNNNTVTREPIQNLIDKDNEIINEHLIDIIEDYKITAQRFPTNNRCCIMCYHKVYNGAFMCSKHNLIYSFINV